MSGQRWDLAEDGTGHLYFYTADGDSVWELPLRDNSFLAGNTRGTTYHKHSKNDRRNSGGTLRQKEKKEKKEKKREKKRKRREKERRREKREKK